MKRKILINSELVELWSDDGKIWFADKDATKNFGLYTGMKLENWGSVEYLNEVRGGEIEITSVEILRSLIRFEMINRIRRWAKKVGKFYGEPMDGRYRLEDENDEFLFYFDGEIYEIINRYNSDGYNPDGLGEKFECIADNTGWHFDFLEYSVVKFYKDF